MDIDSNRVGLSSSAHDRSPLKCCCIRKYTSASVIDKHSFQCPRKVRYLVSQSLNCIGPVRSADAMRMLSSSSLIPSLSYDSTDHWCCLIAASIALALAPTTSPTFSPFLKNKKVGMARMPSSCATSGTSSTSTLKNLTFGYSSEYFTIVGAIVLQGPHQTAKQSSTTSVEGSASMIEVWKPVRLRMLDTRDSRGFAVATYSARLWTVILSEVDLKL